MMKKTDKRKENYLEKIPVRSEKVGWSSNDDGIVTIEIENKGIFNTLAQKFFKKPRISYVHLDAIGSFVWPLIDGKKTIEALAVDVELKFGEDAYPLYERLAKYFQILDSYGFVNLTDGTEK